MGIEENIFSVEMVGKNVEIITRPGVGIFGGGGLRFLTPAQQHLVNNLVAWGLHEIVFDPVA